MPLNARKLPNTNSGPKAPPMEPGTYPARVVQIIDLGLQPQRPYKGEEKKPAYEIMVTYEFVDEFLKDEEGEDRLDKPRWLSETFPLHSLQADRAKSTARYYALDPDEVHEGDWSKLLETPCMVTVVNNVGQGKNAGTVYDNITAVSTMREKEAKRLAPLVNEPKYIALDEDDAEKFLTLPEWLQNKIKEGLEFDGTELDKALKRHTGKTEKKAPKKADVQEAGEDDEIPFEPDADEESGENW